VNQGNSSKLHVKFTISPKRALRAGIAGITAAYLLAGLGKRVIVLEAQEASGLAETGHTTGHLSCVLDDRLSEVERIHGTARLQTAVQSHREAISWIERTMLAEQIDCDFQRVPGYLFLGPTDSPRLLEREQAAAQRIGLACEWLDALPFATPAPKPCLRFADQAQFHATIYLSGLLLAAIRRGVRVYFPRRYSESKGDRYRGSRLVAALWSLPAPSFSRRTLPFMA
jgi:glycine/D-amino acid oxidase-like deaminating enzyme